MFQSKRHVIMAREEREKEGTREERGIIFSETRRADGRGVEGRGKRGTSNTSRDRRGGEGKEGGRGGGGGISYENEGEGIDTN